MTNSNPRGAGRKPASSAERRSQQIAAYFTDAERDEIESVVESSGERRGDLLRKWILTGARNEEVDDRTTVGRLLGELYALLVVAEKVAYGADYEIEGRRAFATRTPSAVFATTIKKMRFLRQQIGGSEEIEEIEKRAIQIVDALGYEFPKRRLTEAEERAFDAAFDKTFNRLETSRNG